MLTKHSRRLRHFNYFSRTLLSQKSAASDGNVSEWVRARPFNEIPTMSKISAMKNFMRGGKYYGKNTAELLKALYDDYGDIFYISGMFGKPNVVLTHNPDDFAKIFHNDGRWPIRNGGELMAYHRSQYRKDFFQGIEGIIATQQEQWGKFRSIINPILLKPENIKIYAKQMSEVNMEFIERIKEIRDPNTFEVPDTFTDEINRWTLESVSLLALDKKLGIIGKELNNPDTRKLFTNLKKSFDLTYELEGKLSFWKYFATPNFNELMRTFDEVNSITIKYVNKAIGRLEESNRETSVVKPESVLEKLLKIDKKVATVMAMDMLTGGVDTTSTSFIGIMLCLAKNLDKQEILRNEIRRFLPEKDSPVSENNLMKVPYLRACIKEGLRMYPLTIGNMRKTQKNLVLSGYQVPKGTEVSTISIAILRNPKYFTNPNDFIPERWLREPLHGVAASEIDRIHPFANLPFGFGPRSCIGKRIVDLELEIGISRIIRNFKVEFNYPTENAFKCLLINVPAIPMKFKFADISD